MTLRKVLPGIALVATALALQPAVASAAPFKFHVHMDAYGKGDGYDYVGWCNGTSDCASIIGAKVALPDGYSRWMELCSGADCRGKLIGAVRMPNGPFLVVGGKVDGREVARQHESKGVESDGGPLFLHVGYHGFINNGGGVPGSHGYVFGLRGWIQF